VSGTGVFCGRSRAGSTTKAKSMAQLRPRGEQFCHDLVVAIALLAMGHCLAIGALGAGAVAALFAVLVFVLGRRPFTGRFRPPARGRLGSAP
jgi:hypothetical protein